MIRESFERSVRVLGGPCPRLRLLTAGLLAVILGARVLVSLTAPPSYGHAEILHGISLGMDAGSIVTVIGANGAGKTTLLNAVMGVIPSSGTVFYDGRPAPRSVEGRVSAGMCLVPERRELFSTMTVEA